MLFISTDFKIFFLLDSSILPLSKTYLSSCWKLWKGKHRASVHVCHLQSRGKIGFGQIFGGAAVSSEGTALGKAFKESVEILKNFPRLSKSNENNERHKGQWYPWSKVISHFSVSTLILASPWEISSKSIANGLRQDTMCKSLGANN